MSVNKKELKDRLYWMVDEKSEYHEDLIPKKSMSLDDLMELYFYWADEYNDGYLGYDENDCEDDIDKYLLVKYEMYRGDIDYDTPLTEDQVRCFWDIAPLFIDFGDSDAMCQDNGYTLDQILNYMDQGCEVFIDL